ncbi:MAG: hypothetical protein FWC42_02065 [Proteobacteria bacterium]|nr:hypothetical protein [Pseudomonadota bacterium]
MDVDEKTHMISMSAESRLKRFQYHSGKILLNFVNGEGEHYGVSVETECLQTTLKEIRDDVNYVFSISAVKLEDFLLAENGVYMPPRDFIGLMRSVRDGFSLAFGLRQSKYSMLLSLEGDFVLHCIIKDMSAVNFERLDFAATGC